MRRPERGEKGPWDPRACPPREGGRGNPREPEGGTGPEPRGAGHGPQQRGAGAAGRGGVSSGRPGGPGARRRGRGGEGSAPPVRPARRDPSGGGGGRPGSGSARTGATRPRKRSGGRHPALDDGGRPRASRRACYSVPEIPLREWHAPASWTGTAARPRPEAAGRRTPGVPALSSALSLGGRGYPEDVIDG
ncbi:hypothetical protein THAOC_33909, partial [Thalassiosira oceanica]